MAAPIVGAIDQHPPETHFAHRAEGDLERSTVGLCGRVADRAGHATIEAAS